MVRGCYGIVDPEWPGPSPEKVAVSACADYFHLRQTGSVVPIYQLQSNHTAKPKCPESMLLEDGQLLLIEHRHSWHFRDDWSWCGIEATTQDSDDSESILH